MIGLVLTKNRPISDYRSRDEPEAYPKPLAISQTITPTLTSFACAGVPSAKPTVTTPSALIACTILPGIVSTCCLPVPAGSRTWGGFTPQQATSLRAGSATLESPIVTKAIAAWLSKTRAAHPLGFLETSNGRRVRNPLIRPPSMTASGAHGVWRLSAPGSPRGPLVIGPVPMAAPGRQRVTGAAQSCLLRDDLRQEFGAAADPPSANEASRQLLRAPTESAFAPFVGHTGGDAFFLLAEAKYIGGGEQPWVATSGGATPCRSWPIGLSYCGEVPERSNGAVSKTDAGRPALSRLVLKRFLCQSVKRHRRPLVSRLVPTLIGAFGSKIGFRAAVYPG